MFKFSRQVMTYFFTLQFQWQFHFSTFGVLLPSPWCLMLLGSHWSLLVLPIGVEGVSIAGSSDFSWWWMPQDLRDFPGMDADFGRPILCILLFLGVKEKSGSQGQRKEAIWMAEYLFLPAPSIYFFVSQQKRNPQAGVEGRRCSLGHSFGSSPNWFSFSLLSACLSLSKGLTFHPEGEWTFWVAFCSLSAIRTHQI